MKHFTIRDLFWLVLVVGIGLGWWVERRRLIRETASLRDTLSQMIADKLIIEQPPRGTMRQE